MPVDALLGFAVVYICSKLNETQLSYYLVAVILILGLYLSQSMLKGFELVSVSIHVLVIKFVIACSLFYLLDKNEDSIGGSVAIFTVGYFAVVFIFKSFSGLPFNI